MATILGLIESSNKLKLIEDIKEEASTCSKCPIHLNGLGSCAFYRGNPNASIALLSEKSGPQEAEKGYPFAGGTEKEVQKNLSLAGLLSWDNVFATNCCICVLPKERPSPTAAEIKNCTWWKKGIGIVSPKLIIAMGRVAIQQMTGSSDFSVTNMNGKKAKWNGIDVICTFNPAYLLRVKKDNMEIYNAAIEPWSSSILSAVNKIRNN